MLANEPLKLDNGVSIFSINLNIVLYQVFLLNVYKYPKYHQHQCCHILLKNYRHPYNPAFFILSTKNYFEILPKHNQDTFASKSLVLNLYISTPLTNI